MAMKFTVVGHKASFYGETDSPAYIATHSTFEEAWRDALDQQYPGLEIEIRDMDGHSDFVHKLDVHGGKYRPLLRPTEQMHEMLRAQPEECLETADQAAVDAGAWG